MKKLVISLLCLSSLALAVDLASAAEKVVNFSYVGRDLKGAERWRAKARIENVAPGVYLMTEEAEGVYSSFKGRISWVARMKFERTEDSVRPMSLDKKVFDDKGNMIRHEIQDFDLAGNTAVCTHKEPARSISRTKKFKFDRDVVTRLSLGFYAVKFIAGGKTSEKLQMVSEEPNVYNVVLKRMGKEVVEISGQKISAYRMCVEPDLGPLGFVNKFLPITYAWHSAVPDYEWLGFEGLEGGINSEKVKVSIERL